MSDQPSDPIPEPLLSSEDDATVSALLRAAGGPVPMPAEVAARIEAALAAESSTRVASGSVTPLVPRQRRWTRAVLGLAAAAAVVLVGGALVTTLGDGVSGGDDQATSAEAGGAADTADLARSATGRDYTPAELPESVASLLGDEGTPLNQPSVPSSVDSVGPQGSPEADAESMAEAPGALASTRDAETGQDDLDAAAATHLVLDEARLAPCLERLTDGRREVVAVDAGTYEGEPAVAVVLAAGTEAVDVFIVTPACSADDASILHFERVDR
ncbi:MAG: hypothetical protein ABWZ26_04565 [Candidatus Nanopelagicales bacterium]